MIVEFRHSPEDSIDSKKGSVRTHTRIFYARSDNPAADTTEILSDPAVPQELTIDQWDGGCLVISRNARRRPKSLIWWTISVTSTTEIDANEKNPLDAPTVWEAETVLYEVPIIYDRFGKPIVNSAGQLFEGPTKNVVGWTFTANKSLPDVPLDWVDDFTNGVNDSTITIRGKRCKEKTAWLRSARIGAPRREFNVTHCPSSFVFEYNPLGFLFEPLDRGFMELVERVELDSKGSPTKVRRLVEILDDRGQPVTQAQFLNSDGQVPRIRAPDGRMVRKSPLEASDIRKLTFEIKDPVPFRRLGVLT
jgi:hypothetical protein